MIRIRRAGMAAAAASLLVTAAACGADSSAASGADAPGVTADTITIGQMAAWGGDFADPVNRSNEGLVAWVNKVNAEGGIHGRKIEIKQYDHKETADGGIAACQQVLSDDDVLFSTELQGTGAHLTAANCLDQAQFPNIVWQGADEYLDTWQYTKAILPTPGQMGVTTAKYVKSRLQPGDRVGLIYVDQDIYQAAADGFREQAAAEGLDLVAIEPVGIAQTSFVPQLERLRAAGATTVVIEAIGQETAILNDAAKLDYRPHWTGSLFPFEYAPQANPGLYDGVTGLKVTTAGPNETYTAFQADYAQYSSGQYPDTDPDSMLPYAFGELITEVIDKAGPNPTRESVLAAMNEISNFKTGVMGPITWTDQVVGTQELWPVVCCTPENFWKADGEPSADFGQ